MQTTEWWFLLDRTNKYFTFIKECRSKKYDDGATLHKHHIIPRYWFCGTSKEELAYCDSQENLVILSLEDHIRAHELLYEIYGRPQDEAAVQMLRGNKEESVRLWRKLGAAVTHEILKSEGITFWNKDFQKEMATRSKARPDALETRSKGGLVGGRNRNLNRVITVSDRYIFFYNNEPVLCVLNCQTGGDVLKELHSFKKTSLQRVTPLLDGSRKKLNGWSCEKILDSKYIIEKDIILR